MQFVPGYQNLDNSMFGEIAPPPHHNGLPSASWLHVPPMHMPWGTPLSDQPSIVRFTAESAAAAAEAAASSTLAGIQTEIYNSNAFQCKRKIETEFEIRPPKKHITEEKMAAHMSQLSISGDYSQTTISADTLSEEKPSTSTAVEDSSLGRRLILSDELRALQSEPILPQSLISKLEKPSMALVLWQPPAGSLGEQLRSAARLNASHSAEERLRQQQLQQQQQQQQLDSNDNNNTPAAVDLNAFTPQQGLLISDDNSEMEL